MLSGTPTAHGNFNFTVTATDSSGGAGPYSGSRALTLTVNAPTIALSPASLPDASIGASYSQTVTAAGGTGAYSYAVTAGALPAGLALSPAGVLSGTATAGGTFNFTITATDSSTGAGPYGGSRAYTVTVGAPTWPTNSRRTTWRPVRALRNCTTPDRSDRHRQLRCRPEIVPSRHRPTPRRSAASTLHPSSPTASSHRPAHR